MACDLGVRAGTTGVVSRPDSPKYSAKLDGASSGEENIPE